MDELNGWKDQELVGKIEVLEKENEELKKSLAQMRENDQQINEEVKGEHEDEYEIQIQKKELQASIDLQAKLEKRDVVFQK